MEEGGLKGRSEGTVTPDLIPLFKSSIKVLVSLNVAQLFQYSTNAGKEKGREMGHKKRKMFDIQAGRLREVTSSWPFQKTWPPTV